MLKNYRLNQGDSGSPTLTCLAPGGAAGRSWCEQMTSADVACRWHNFAHTEMHWAFHSICAYTRVFHDNNGSGTSQFQGDGWGSVKKSSPRSPPSLGRSFGTASLAAWYLVANWSVRCSVRIIFECDADGWDPCGCSGWGAWSSGSFRCVSACSCRTTWRRYVQKKKCQNALGVPLARQSSPPQKQDTYNKTVSLQMKELIPTGDQRDKMSSSESLMEHLWLKLVQKVCRYQSTSCRRAQQSLVRSAWMKWKQLSKISMAKRKCYLMSFNSRLNRK